MQHVEKKLRVIALVRDRDVDAIVFQYRYQKLRPEINIYSLDRYVGPCRHYHSVNQSIPASDIEDLRVRRYQFNEVLDQHPSATSGDESPVWLPNYNVTYAGSLRQSKPPLSGTTYRGPQLYRYPLKYGRLMAGTGDLYGDIPRLFCLPFRRDDSLSGGVTMNVMQRGEARHAMHQQHRHEDLKRRYDHKQPEYRLMIGRRFARQHNVAGADGFLDKIAC